MAKQEHIRNFSIIAHIDHGKSTLADRIMEKTGLISDRQKKDQYLDRMELEQERGITIKAQSVRIPFKSRSGREYILNLIDTPGHVDFSYEVSRSLAACDGALLVVDATQGVEAQTLANVYMALDNDLEVLPVLNKIDLPSAEPDRVAEEIEEVIGLDCTDIAKVSAKTGLPMPAETPHEMRPRRYDAARHGALEWDMPLVNLVRRTYAADFETFGYKPEP